MKTTEFYGHSDFVLEGVSGEPGKTLEDVLLWYDAGGQEPIDTDTLEQAARKAAEAVLHGSHMVTVLQRVNGKYAVCAR